MQAEDSTRSGLSYGRLTLIVIAMAVATAAQALFFKLALMDASGRVRLNDMTGLFLPTLVLTALLAVALNCVSSRRRVITDAVSGSRIKKLIGAGVLLVVSHNFFVWVEPYLELHGFAVGGSLLILVVPSLLALVIEARFFYAHWSAVFRMFIGTVFVTASLISYSVGGAGVARSLLLGGAHAVLTSGFYVLLESGLVDGWDCDVWRQTALLFGFACLFELPFVGLWWAVRGWSGLFGRFNGWMLGLAGAHVAVYLLTPLMIKHMSSMMAVIMATLTATVSIGLRAWWLGEPIDLLYYIGGLLALEAIFCYFMTPLAARPFEKGRDVDRHERLSDDEEIEEDVRGNVGYYDPQTGDVELHPPSGWASTSGRGSVRGASSSTAV